MRDAFQSTRPAWGRDLRSRSTRPNSRNFNPRALTGARPKFERRQTDGDAFQSTRPHGGATKNLDANNITTEFQSTRPHGGATGIEEAFCLPGNISIHAPRVGRDLNGFTINTSLRISIHAPRVGRDHKTNNHSIILRKFQSTRPVWGATTRHFMRPPFSPFQSTRPVWGATKHIGAVINIPYISIHAPRVGRDGKLAFFHGDAFPFQSTRPVWGATRCLPGLASSPCNFNPRAPCGARPCRQGLD